MSPLVFRTPRKKAVGLGLLCLVMTAGCVLVLFDGGLSAVAAILGILLFGVGGAYAVGKQLRQAPVLTLTTDGVLPGSGGLVPWADVVAFGTTRIGSARCLGLALRDPTRYLASLTPEQARLARAVGLGARISGPVLGAADPTSAAEAAKLVSVPHQDLAAMLAWSKVQTGGYELAWSSLLFAGRLEAVAATCEAYRRRATGAPGPP
jgi:hypothetical protein